MPRATAMKGKGETAAPAASSLEPRDVPSSISLLIPSLKGTILVGGIYIFFLESVFKTGNPPNDKFSFPIFIVVLLCIANAIFSGGILFTEHFTKRHPLDVIAPPIDDTGIPHYPKSVVKRSHKRRTFMREYVLDLDYAVMRDIALSSATYIISMICTNYALSHVNYPTQVLVKSAKSVPVVLGGRIFFGKRYPLHDYVAVFAVTISLLAFNLSRATGKSSQQTFLGMALLLVSLFSDSMTGPRQDQLLAQVKISSTHLMFLTNVCASFFGLVIWGIFEGLPAIQFCVRYPTAIVQILYFCASAALGQLFIFGSLTEFGSLHLTLITTTRKFFTVLLSVILFGHNVTALQWCCVAAIFLSLGFQSVLTKKLKRKVAAAQQKGHKKE